MSVFAYHITWTTYGTWLPGDARGWVKWGEWGVKPPDPERERDARKRMAESAVVLTKEQRTLVEQTNGGREQRPRSVRFRHTPADGTCGENPLFFKGFRR